MASFPVLGLFAASLHPSHPGLPDRTRPGVVPDRPGASMLYDIDDPDLVDAFVIWLGHNLQDESCPPEVRQLGRIIVRWADQIAAWHHAHVSNGPTEAINNLIKRVKRVAFGFRRFAHYRSGPCSYTGRPNWGLLADNYTPLRSEEP